MAQLDEYHEETIAIAERNYDSDTAINLDTGGRAQELSREYFKLYVEPFQ